MSDKVLEEAKTGIAVPKNGKMKIEKVIKKTEIKTGRVLKNSKNTKLREKRFKTDKFSITIDGKEVYSQRKLSPSGREFCNNIIDGSSKKGSGTLENAMDRKFYGMILKYKKENVTMLVSKVKLGEVLSEKSKNLIHEETKKLLKGLKEEFTALALSEEFGEGIISDYVFKKMSELPAIEDKLPETLESIMEKVLEIEMESMDKNDTDNIEIPMKVLYYKNTLFSDISGEFLQEYCIQVRDILEEVNGVLPKDYDIFENEDVDKKLRELEYLKITDGLTSELKEYPMDYLDFKVSIFVNHKKKSLVLCFNDKSEFSRMKEDLSEKKYRSIFVLMNILRNFRLEKLFIENEKIKLRDYTMTVTGVDVGGELANIFYLATEKTHATIFKTKNIDFHGSVRTFNTSTIASMFNMKYRTNSEIVDSAVETLRTTSIFESKWGSLGQVIGMVGRLGLSRIKFFGVVSLAGAGTIAQGFLMSTFISVFIVPLLIMTVSIIIDIIENNQNNEYYAYLYVQLCRIGIVNCNLCKEGAKSINKCQYVRNGGKYIGKEPPLISNDKIKDILNDTFDMFPEFEEKLGKKIKVTGDTFLNVITEFFLLDNNINNFYKLLDNIKKDVDLNNTTKNMELIEETKGIFNTKGIFRDDNNYMKSREEEFLMGLKILKSLDRQLYDKVESKVISSLKYAIDKYTHIYLEPTMDISQNNQTTNSSSKLYELKKKYFYTCTVTKTIGNEEYFIGDDNDDPSLGAVKHFFLEIINIISDVQNIQHNIKNNEKIYKVFAFGIPSEKTESGKDRCKKNQNTPIIYSRKNNFLTSTESGYLGVERVPKTAHQGGEIYKNEDYVEKWNKMYNKDYYEEKIPVLSNEFVFFPVISGSGVIAHDELYCACENSSNQQENNEDLKDGYISKYFKESETIVTNVKNIPNTPNMIEKANIRYAAKRLDAFREYIDIPFNVSSWFRNKDVNKEVGGVWNSYHMQGLAIDVKVPGVSSRYVWDKARKSGIEFDQLILYNTFVHFGFRLPSDPRGKERGQVIPNPKELK